MTTPILNVVAEGGQASATLMHLPPRCSFLGEIMLHVYCYYYISYDTSQLYLRDLSGVRVDVGCVGVYVARGRMDLDGQGWLEAAAICDTSGSLYYICESVVFDHDR